MKNDEKRLEKERQLKQFYMLLKAIMDELFRYTRSRHIKIPDASFGLVYEEKESILFTGLDSKTGKRIYLYNVRLIGKSFEEKKEKMLSEKTPETFLSWIGELCSTFLSPFVYNYVAKEQHRVKVHQKG